jgi:hypothetical protein
MIDVEEWQFRGVAAKTRLWVSQAVVKAVRSIDGSERPKLVKRLKRYVSNGFWNYLDESFPIKHERDGVYRIGHRNDLFRILGFFENDATKQSFIAVDAFTKNGQNLKDPEQHKIDQVAAIKNEGGYKKVE